MRDARINVGGAENLRLTTAEIWIILGSVTEGTK